METLLGRPELLLVLLLAATVAAVHHEDALLTRQLVIEPSQLQPALRYAYDDSGTNGASRVTADPRQALSGRCILAPGYQFPFCGFGVQLNLEDPGDGVDLANLESVTLDVTYQGPGETVSLTLKNNDPRYSRPGNATTDKMNRIDLDVRPGRQTIALQDPEFEVPEWWLQQRSLREHLSHPQFDNIVAVEIQTGGDFRLGTHLIQVHRLHLKSRIFTRASLYSALVLLWILAICGLGWLRGRETARLHRALADRSQKILDAIPQMVWTETSTGDEFWNRQWKSFTGCQPGTDGVTRRDLVHPDDWSAADRRWKHSLQTGEPYEAEYRLRHNSGDYRWVLSRGRREAGDDEAGDPQWFGTCTDIHEQVLAREQVKSLQSELIHLSRTSAMGSMATTVAHEVNQPLAAAAIFASVLRKQIKAGAAPGELMEASDGVERAVLRAGEIVRRLRQMAQGKAPQSQPVSAIDLVRDTLRLLGDKGAKVPVHLALEEDAVLLCDPVQIQQVLLNLIKNAIEAVENEPDPHVRVHMTAEGASLRIAVEDNGPGIEPVRLTSLFDTLSSTKADGMGVGLAISRTILEAHGSSIQASNLDPHGARFQFALPLADPQNPPAAAPPAD